MNDFISNSALHKNDFISNALCKPQIRKAYGRNPYHLTPFTYFFNSKNENDYVNEIELIDSYTRTFKKPMNILAYGNEYKNTNLNTMMVRGWLHEDIDYTLNILIMIERLKSMKELKDSNKYYFILNNPHWYPTIEFFKEKSMKKNDELFQEVDYLENTYLIK